MKVLVTGMNAGQTNRKRYQLSFTSMLCRAMELDGHDVTMTRITDSGRFRLWDYDAVIVGVASPLAPGSRYAVPAMSIMHEALQEGVLRAVIVDDPDARKIWHGTRSAMARPDRLWSDYYSERPDVLRLRDDHGFQERVLSALEWMHDGMDGTVPLWWPAHPWVSDNTLYSVLAVQGRSDLSTVAPIDPTSLILSDAPGTPMVPPGGGWVEEQSFGALPADVEPGLQRSMTVMRERATDLSRVLSVYHGMYGVIQGSVGSRSFGGWWTPTPAIAALAGRIFVPSLEEGRLMGSPYYLLAEDVEDIDMDKYESILLHQRNTLEEESWQIGRLISEINGALGA